MNVSKNTNILKKLIISLCIVMIMFSFVFPKYVNAFELSDIVEEIQMAPCRIFYAMRNGDTFLVKQFNVRF